MEQWSKTMSNLFRWKTARRFPLAAAALAALAVTGCGGAGSVSGQVKYDGKPLPAGKISFLSQAGEKPVRMVDITDGKYTVTNLPAGPAQITVQTIPPPTVGGGPQGPNIIPPSGGTPPDKYVQIPAKYANAEQSGLTYEVKGGSQTHDIDLAP